MGHSSIYERARVSHFLQGLYNEAGEPVYPKGMEVMAHNIGATFRNRIRTPRLLIIEFILAELSDTGTAGKMLHMSLASNYVSSKKDFLHHIRILFDLENEDAIKKHAKTIREKLRKVDK